MTEQRNSMAQLFAACWKDDALKKRFMNDPKAVLAEHGLEVAEDIDVRVVENTDNTVHITLPGPPKKPTELSDDELNAAAGGADAGICKPFKACSFCSVISEGN